MLGTDVNGDAISATKCKRCAIGAHNHKRGRTRPGSGHPYNARDGEGVPRNVAHSGLEGEDLASTALGRNPIHNVSGCKRC